MNDSNMTEKKLRKFDNFPSGKAKQIGFAYANQFLLLNTLIASKLPFEIYEYEGYPSMVAYGLNYGPTVFSIVPDTKGDEMIAIFVDNLVDADIALESIRNDIIKNVIIWTGV